MLLTLKPPDPGCKDDSDLAWIPKQCQVVQEPQAEQIFREEVNY
jgi:hypothetical protein